MNRDPFCSSSFFVILIFFSPLCKQWEAWFYDCMVSLPTEMTNPEGIWIVRPHEMITKFVPGKKVTSDKDVVLLSNLIFCTFPQQHMPFQHSPKAATVTVLQNKPELSVPAKEHSISYPVLRSVSSLSPLKAEPSWQAASLSCYCAVYTPHLSLKA